VLTRPPHLRYLPEIDLGPEYDPIDNPVFAVYPGQLWKRPDITPDTWLNDTETNAGYQSRTAVAAALGSVSAMPNFNATENVKWQKERSCENRYMGGPANLYPNCTIIMETGRGELENLGRIVEYVAACANNNSFSRVLACAKKGWSCSTTTPTPRAERAGERANNLRAQIRARAAQRPTPTPRAERAGERANNLLRVRSRRSRSLASLALARAIPIRPVLTLVFALA
jgi:hypothetical protein